MQRYFASSLKDDNFILNDSDLYHIKVVMRMKENDLIEVVYDNQLYIGQLDFNYNVKLNKLVENEIVSSSEYILCLPLLTDQKMSFVLQKATELGVDKIVPIITNRSIVKLDDKQQEKKLNRWHLICKEASEQSKRLTIPIVTEIKKIADLKFDGLKMVCSTNKDSLPLKKVIQKAQQIVFVVGPEGGLEQTEEKLLNDLGFISVSLGNNIFRVETVPIYLLSILKYEE